MRLGLCHAQAPRMPAGLVQLMEGLSRDVLRANPQDLYQFCADHMQKLLVLRAAHEGRTRTMTLEEKISRAQSIIRQRAEKRRRRYDEPDRRSPGFSDEEEIMENDTQVTPRYLSPSIAVPESCRSDICAVDESSDKEEESIETTAELERVENGKVSTAKEDAQELADDDGESIENDTRATPPHLSSSIAVPESFRSDICEVDESSDKKELLDKEEESMETTPELENAEDGNVETAKENAQELAGDDGNTKQEDDGKFKPSSANEENQEDMGQKYDGNVEHTILALAHTKEVFEDPVVKTEEQLLADTSAVNKALVQGCDERLIENRMFELGEKENETENKGLAEETNQKSTNGTVEIPSENEARKERSSKVMEDTFMEDIIQHDGITSNEKQIIDSIVDPGVNVTVETEQTIVNKIKDEINHEALSCLNPQDDTVKKVDDNIKITKTENTKQDTIEDAAEIKSEVDKIIPDEDNDSKLDNPTDIKPKEKYETQETNTEIQTEFAKVNTEGEEETINDKCTDYKINDDKDNTLNIEPEDTESNKHKFEMVTIEVKAPTPLPDAETQDEIIETDTFVESDEVFSKENEKVLSEVRKSEENMKESKDELVEEAKQEIMEPINGTPSVTNEVINNDADIIEIYDQPLNENKMESTIILSSNEDETDSASVNNAALDKFVDNKNSVQLDTERMSYMSIPQNDEFDINAIAKSDSTNDIIIEETTESISETNTEADEREENTNNAPAMDLETAAVTIQKVFRTFLFKSRASTLDDVSNDEVSMDAAMPEVDEGVHDPKQEDEFANITERRTLGITRMDTVLQTVNEEKSLSLSTDDSSTLSSAATTIQAHVRGFLVRNRLHSNKTTSLSSLVNSDGLSSSLDAANEQRKTKTVLNIHIVPDGGHFMSRDESMAMSLDLPLDTSPPSSLSNLHPLSFDVSERRKLLKREDAIQSISPPSNNSGKLSEDSGKEVIITESDAASTHRTTDDDIKTGISFQMEQENAGLTSGDTSPTKSVTVETVLEMAQETGEIKTSFPVQDENKPGSVEQSADEMDVVTPFVCSEEKVKVETPRLLHSGECHDIMLPTCVSRSETTVIREFKSVLGYFLLWNTAS